MGASSFYTYTIIGIDGFALLIYLLALLLILRFKIRVISIACWQITIGIIILNIVHSIGNILEWTGITAFLDITEEYIEIVLASLWFLLFYVFLRDIEHDALEKEKIRAQTYLDISGVIMLLLDDKGKAVLINKKGCEVLGYEEKEIIGKNWLENFIPDRTKPDIKRIFRQVVDGEKEHGEYYESLILTKAGEEKIIRWHNAMIRDEKGKIIATLSSGEDVTDRKKAEQDLRESEEKYRKLVDAANDTIFLADPETGLIIDANQKAADLLGRPVNEIIGTHQSNIHPPEDADFYRDMFKSHAQAKMRFVQNAFVQHKDGHHIPVRISANIINLRGKPMLMGIFTDITELKKIEEKLRGDKDSLEEMVAQKTKDLTAALKDLEDAKRLSDIGALAATVAHELRNPLSVIKTAVYNITKKNKDKDLEAHLKNIDKKIAEGDGIIRNLLAYSKIKTPHYDEVHIHRLLDECLNNCKSRYKNKNIEVVRNYGIGENDIIEADPLQMTELFTNILDNAFQSFSTNKGRIDIRVRANNDEKKAEIEIRDNGSGILKKNIKEIFEPFFTTKPRGIGLGLTVCRQVISLHSGTINIKSIPSGGTSVFIALPINR